MEHLEGMRRAVAPLKERLEAAKEDHRSKRSSETLASFELVRDMYVKAMEPVFVAAEEQRKADTLLRNTNGCQVGFIHDDGGRAQAGFKGSAGDCVVRAFCILTGADYKAAYKEFAYAQSVLGSSKKRSARNGVSKRAYEHVFREHGLTRVRLTRGVKPTWSEAHERYGDCIVSTRGHLAAVVDGAVRDTHDERGYWWSQQYQEVLGSDYNQVPTGARDVEWRERKAMSVWRMS